jgi:hypothetical protein
MALASPATALPSNCGAHFAEHVQVIVAGGAIVPKATLTPAAMHLATGQKPLASFRLDSGQCTI